MRTSKRLFVILIVLFSSAVISAQDGRWGPPPARKIDEFKFSTQGYVKMLLDSFFNELNNNPADQGNVIIYPKAERQRRAIEKIVRTHIRWRRFDATRVTIVRGPINADGIVQLWSVPPGADAPKPVLGEETGQRFVPRTDITRPNPYGVGIGTGRGDGSVPVPDAGSARYSDGDGSQPSGNDPNAPAQPVVTDRPLKILSKPKANYTEPARANKVQGTIRLKVTFLANGTIGAIVPITRLPNGLTEQAESAARLIRFEPAMKNGVLVTTTKVLEYPFIIY